MDWILPGDVSVFEKPRFASTHENDIKACVSNRSTVRTFSNIGSVFGDRERRLRVDGDQNGELKYAFSNENGCVWSGP